MFAKKFLSIVSTLFIGSRLVSKAIATGIPECSTAVTDYEEATFKGLTACGAGAITAYCKIGSDPFLVYGYDSAASATCSTALDGAYAFNEDAGTIIDLGTTDIGSPDIKTNVAIYNCNGDECKKTSGIIRDNTNNYIVAAEGGASSASSIEDSTCATGKIDTGDNVLCLDSTIKGSTVGKRYIMENVASNAFGTSGDNSKFIVVKRVANIYAYDNLVENDEYCVGSTTKILSGTLEDFQTTDGTENSATCDKYYSCSSNLCSDVTSVSTCTRTTTTDNPCSPKVGGSDCNAGYYITKEADGTTVQDSASTGYLYSCTGSDGACTPVTNKVGYIPNVSTRYKDTLPYIQCKYSSISDGKIVNACTAISAATINDATACAEANIGGLIKGNKLCVNGETTQAIPLAASNTDNNGDYLINDANLNVFVPSDKETYHVLITVTDEEVELKAYDSSSARYKYAFNNKVYAKAAANLNDGGICSAANKDKIVEFKSDNCDSDKMNFYTEQ